MALDLPLPKQVLTHAHWTIDRAKMSKSVGNVVDPFVALNHFGVDTMRYYLLHDGGIKDDADYADNHVYKRYKSQLQDSLGNLVSRILRSKKWNISLVIQEGHVAMSPEAQYLHQSVNGLRDIVAESIEKRLDPGRALHNVMRVVKQARSSHFLTCYILMILDQRIHPPCSALAGL